MSSHTPGPWVRRDGSAYKPSSEIVVEADGSPIGWHAYGRDDEAIANGQLMASAPELLEACIAMLAAFDAETDRQAEAMRAAADAIVKASGGDHG